MDDAEMELEDPFYGRVDSEEGGPLLGLSASFNIAVFIVTILTSLLSSALVYIFY
ncbi:hypothetical protein K492DRAFT_170439 [Lichtheimia hyalospora FSU 10163]|nr:hypothetical protein K492DRAFT_170439 [Lichtheimia hyalospora FSU 10163]